VIEDDNTAHEFIDHLVEEWATNETKQMFNTTGWKKVDLIPEDWISNKLISLHFKKSEIKKQIDYILSLKKYGTQ